MNGAEFPWVFGLDTFGDLAYDTAGAPLSQAETIRRVVDEAVLAEEVGVEFFGIGEHHTNDWPMPAGDVVLAAIAARTSRIHLGSAVLVLSSDDPVRVFQRYSTLDALSRGRVEVILGRGSSTESFPLFGYDLADYETLFEEKTALFAELLKGEPVTWQGTTRAALSNADVVPHLERRPFPVWLGVGGSPESVVRAARHGFSLMLAIIGGPPTRFAPFAELFRAALDRFGQPARPVGVHSPGHIAATDEQAMDEIWPHYRDVITRVGRTRGWAPPTKDQFVREAGPEGAWYVGSAETVAQKIARNLPALGATRFDLKYGLVGLPHDAVMSNIERYGTEVVPRVRALLAERGATAEVTS
jgi:probable LLM family oxidoreductase